MPLDRRSFLGLTAGAAGAAAAGVRPADAQAPAGDVPKPIRDLRPMTAGIVPISDAERRARIEKARRLMAEHRLDAVVLEGGSSMFYFTGVEWGLSERPFAVVLPARGELAWVTPRFEEERARELIPKSSDDVRAWEEDESPYALLARILRDRGAGTGRVGVEERVRFFVFDGLRRELPQAEYVSADPVTAGCRMYKSPAEIALMQRSNDITIAALRAAFATLREGMTQGDLRRNLEAAFAALGSPGSALVSFGKYTAFPHGSVTPQRLRAGDVVLVDGGTQVEGYASDVTRTTVFGKPTARQRQVWDLEKRAQLAALDAARVGVPCEAVDAAARKVITDAGFGPGYKVPGLPHRTGHGIGLDGHEWTNLVRGNTTPLAPGMCFSDEPTVVIYGEFGIRLEDCFYMTEAGPKLFTQLSPAVDRPFA